VRQLCRRAGAKETRRFPTEQDINDAIERWQLHSGAPAERSDSHPYACFCCDVVNVLSDNSAFLGVLRSMLDHLWANEDGLLDVLLSVYAFGLLTGEVMHERQPIPVHYLPQTVTSSNNQSAGSEPNRPGSK